MRPRPSTTSRVALAGAAASSTNVSGGIAGLAVFAAVRARVVGADGGAGDVPSFHFHHESECALMPVSAANSVAVSPLSFHRSTRFAQTSRDSFAMPTSGTHRHATARSSSGTRFVERIR